MVASDRDARDSDYERVERLIENWALERRLQDRQIEAFRQDVVRIRVANTDDGATAAVFHGERQMSRRERILREHREQVLAELHKKSRRHVLAVRRGTGADVFCRHCGRLVRTLLGPKCEPCKNNPELVTARATETRIYAPRPEAQPSITPLSAHARRVDTVFSDLPTRLRDALERRYLNRDSDHKAAADLSISTALYAGMTTAAVLEIARALARGENPRV